MPVLNTPPIYDSRSVKEWLEMADRGEVLLPNFQRSFVWKPKEAANYLMALLENRPTGILLILEATDPLQFESRFLHGHDFAEDLDREAGEQPRELVLDGQQRLTSLWGALRGTADRRYFIRVRNLAEADLEVEEVTWRSFKWSNPASMYRENWIPVDVLWEPHRRGSPGDSSKRGSGAIKRWCTEAAGEEWDSLFQAVMAIRERLVVNPKLQYCQLRKETDADTAISIFINVNRSAIKLKEVDIAIAIARADHGQDLRGRVAEYLRESKRGQKLLQRKRVCGHSGNCRLDAEGELPQDYSRETPPRVAAEGVTLSLGSEEPLRIRTAFGDDAIRKRSRRGAAIRREERRGYQADTPGLAAGTCDCSIARRYPSPWAGIGRRG